MSNPNPHPNPNQDELLEEEDLKAKVATKSECAPDKN